MMTKSILAILFIGAVQCFPNHLKTVVVDKPVGAVAYGNLGASASWGPFSAGAGIGGNGNGAGIAQAGASASDASAGAGIGGSSSSASASASAGSVNIGKPVKPAGGFFDSIFNIPISVLQSVNTHLNNKDPQEVQYRRAMKLCKRRGICDGLINQGTVFNGAGATAGAGTGGAYGSAGASASASASADAVSRSSAGVSGATGTVAVRKNYDNIFAIPISALTSVNQFLNTGKK